MIFWNNIKVSVSLIAVLTISAAVSAQAANSVIFPETKLKEIKTVKTSDGLSICMVAIDGEPTTESYTYETRCADHNEWKNMFGLYFIKTPESLMDVFNKMPVRLLRENERNAQNLILQKYAPAWRVQPYRNYTTRPVHDVITGKTIDRIDIGKRCGVKSSHTEHKYHRECVGNSGKKGCCVCGYR